MGAKQQDFERFRLAVELLSNGPLDDVDDVHVLALREEMNGAGKRRYSMERILRDHTPGLPLEYVEG